MVAASRNPFKSGICHPLHTARNLESIKNLEWDKSCRCPYQSQPRPDCGRKLKHLNSFLFIGYHGICGENTESHAASPIYKCKVTTFKGIIIISYHDTWSNAEEYIGRQGPVDERYRPHPHTRHPSSHDHHGLVM